MLTQLVLTVLVISFLIGFFAMLIWKKDSPQWKIFPFFYTFLPAIIAILVVFIIEKRWSLGNFSFSKFDPFYVFLGFVIPVIFFAINLAIQTRACSYKLKSGIEWKKILPGIAISIPILIIFVGGEEIGWRGFMQAPLIESFGSVFGIVLLGLIWGVWHAPVALRGYNLRSHFWAEAFVLYPFMCICHSFPLAFLTISSGSIWPALVFHATNNTMGSIGTQIFEKQNSKLEILLFVLTGMFLIVPFAIVL
jgi:membrane protease YdiL (CAAX protease family)